MTAWFLTPYRKWQAAVLAVLEAASKLPGLTDNTGIAAPGETGLQPEEAKALEGYTARAALRQIGRDESLTPEQTDSV